jgi:hypothetical protein
MVVLLTPETRFTVDHLLMMMEMRVSSRPSGRQEKELPTKMSGIKGERVSVVP